MKQVSIKQVAELAGVSIATVSRCLNEPSRVREKTRLRVQDAIVRTGYEPNTLARNFRRGRTNLIMVVLPSVGDPFFTEVLQGIRSVVDAEGYSLIISETQFNTMNADEVGAMLVTRQADGVILLASVFPFGGEVLTRAKRRGQPIVIGCETLSAALADFPSVHIDNIRAAREATEHLLGLGHRRIAFVTAGAGSPLTRDREEGYREAMAAAGETVRPGWVVEGGLSLEGAIRATGDLLTHPERPTAVFCGNDEMALGAMHAIHQDGLNIPGDLSVMGFDDIRYAATASPTLSTIAQPAREIGRRVARRMLNAIDGGPDASARRGEPEIVPHRLVLRNSVAPPPD